MCNDNAHLIYDALLNHPDLASADLRVYDALLTLEEDAYRQQIADMTGLPVWRVSESVRRLKACGLVLVEQRRIDPHERATKNYYSFPVSGNPDVGKSQQSTYLLTLNNHDEKQQLVLIEDQNAQNLGALDVQPQKNLEILAGLGINPHLKQTTPTAPDVARRHTPAEILMFHDRRGDIAANLAAWRQAWDAGSDITNVGTWTPALIWIKIVEMQPPPGAPEPQPAPQQDQTAGDPARPGPQQQLIADVAAEFERIAASEWKRAAKKRGGVRRLAGEVVSRFAGEGKLDKWQTELEWTYGDIVATLANNIGAEMPARGY